MADGMDSQRTDPGPASFSTQANALLRKNLTFQKRNKKTNIYLVFFPVLLCVLLAVLQRVIDSELRKPKNKCGCTCIDTNGDGKCESVCGIQYSSSDQAVWCSIPSPPEWPALMQVPRPEYRAAKTNAFPSEGLLADACRKTQSCPATILLTGENKTFAQSVASKFFTSPSFTNVSRNFSILSDLISGTDGDTNGNNFIEPAFLPGRHLYTIQTQCLQNSTFPLPVSIGGRIIERDPKCVQGLNLWQNDPSDVNNVLYKGYRQGNTKREINEVMAAYDFLDSNYNKYNMRIWYNSTYKNDSAWQTPIGLVRVPRSLNVISNAYLNFMAGDGIKMQLDFIKEMPKPATEFKLDISSLIGATFFKWVIELLLPVILTYLVYEKQHKLRLMMKMHGLGDGPYWVISYSYFLFISSVYMLFFIIFGSVIGLKFFRLNDYSIQFVFYFLYINLQIVLAFLAASFFSDVKTAQAIAYIYIFGSGLLAGYLFVSFVQDTSFSRNWVRVMEIFPAFTLYRGLYEFGQYAFLGDYMGRSGMHWGDLNDGVNGMREVLIIIFVEWLILLPVAYYLDQVISVGNRVKNPFRTITPLSLRRSILQRQSSKVFVEMEKPDVVQEREIVEQLLHEPNTGYAIICNNLRKVYQGRDGNPDKLAVRGLSLALPVGECFGMLGPNGAGKTSFISMMIGLTEPTSGNAYIHGFDIRNDMERIYTTMGVCPQHDMLWEMLTGREHLLFYGRLKNLKGPRLAEAVDESLKSVNLFYGGTADKQAGKYSGGMKRRLSVAISLIGDPKVVYMDEPSTGLDPASRKNLWDVVRRAKQNRAIILTTHSMEEAEVLCDRLGIFVDGSLQCIGNPKQLKGRYGGSYVFTMTTSAEEAAEVAGLARGLSADANEVYHIAGTQKFEIPKQGVRIADVFRAVESAKSRFPVQAWGLADTTLEDVFIKVARAAAASASLA